MSTATQSTAVAAIPAMNPPEVLQSLTAAASAWTGRGSIVECGVWLGASTRALAIGAPEANIQAFDLFMVSSDEAVKARNRGLKIRVGADTRRLIRTLTGLGPDRLTFHKGRIEQAVWPRRRPIELFILDAAKYPAAFHKTIKIFSRAFIPGLTVIGLLDYWFYRDGKNLTDQQRRKLRCQRAWHRSHRNFLIALPHLDRQTARFFRWG